MNRIHQVGLGADAYPLMHEEPGYHQIRLLHPNGTRHAPAVSCSCDRWLRRYSESESDPWKLFAFHGVLVINKDTAQTVELPRRLTAYVVRYLIVPFEMD